jgi:hypothetical protein
MELTVTNRIAAAPASATDRLRLGGTPQIIPLARTFTIYPRPEPTQAFFRLLPSYSTCGEKAGHKSEKERTHVLSFSFAPNV